MSGVSAGEGSRVDCAALLAPDKIAGFRGGEPSFGIGAESDFVSAEVGAKKVRGGQDGKSERSDIMRRSRDSSSSRVEQLFQDLEDGCIDSEQHRELMRLMRTDPAVRREYLKYMDFISLLYSEAEAVAELEGKGQLIDEPSQKTQLFRAGLIAAAVIGIGAWIAALVIPEPPTPAGITAGPGAVWTFASGGIDKETLKFVPGTAVELKTGTLEVSLSSGSNVILEGPAKFDVRGPSELRMHSGRLWTRAEGEAFVIETDRLRITDLGTEFGVMLSGSSEDEVHLAEGKVRLELLDQSEPMLELGTGEAARINRVGRLRRIPFDRSKFQTELPTIPPFLHWSFDTQEDDQFPAKGSVLEPMPMELFSLEQRDTPLEAHSAEGVFGEALVLGTERLFGRSDFPGISGDLPRTVSLWVKGSGFKDDQTLILFSWGLASEEGTKWVMGLSSLALSSGWGGDWAHSTVPEEFSPLKNDEWHHVAQVFTGAIKEDGQPEIIHYLNGQALELNKGSSRIGVDTDCTAKVAWPLTLGTQVFTQVSVPTFTGAIDELYVFRSALSAEQIGILYRENRLPFQKREPKK